MFGDYIGRGSAGGVFTSPTDPNQVIKIMNLNSRDEMVRHMNRLQLQFFEELESQQKQGIKTPGLPNISYTFTGEMNPHIMEQMRESILERNKVWEEDEHLSGLDYSDIKGKFRYGDEYAIVLMDRVGQIGTPEPLGRRGLTPMLRHAYNMGYYVRDLWPENKGMSAAGDIIWFDPMVVPVKATTGEDRRAQEILLEWNEDTQSRYQDAIRDRTYFDYEHKAGLFYSENTPTTTLVTYEDFDNSEWVKKARDLILNDHFETGIIDEDGNRYAETMLGSDWSEYLRSLIDANPNGFLMSGSHGHYNNEKLRNRLWKGDGLDYTFWVFPVNRSGPTTHEKKWDGIVLDGNYIMSGGKAGGYDTFPLGDLFDAYSGENPKYYLYGFTKAISTDPKPWTTINYSGLEKSFSAESYKPPAAAISAAKKGLAQRKKWGRGGLSPSEAKAQGIDSGVTRARKIASGKVSKHDVRRMSAFNRHRKNNRPDKKMPDGGPTAGTIAWNLWGGTAGVNWAKKKSATMNAEEDNYWLRGGCGKAADAIAAALDQQDIPYQFELGAAYMDDAFVGNHIVVIANDSDMDMYGTSGAKARWEDMMLADYGMEDLPRSVSNDIMRFHWQTVDPATDWSMKVEGDYLPISGPLITKETLGMSAEDYPECYLCPKPAKIEVMTAVGMRSFCGNQCRGHYEGIDYGPDDYYISPPLEHDLEIVHYDPGNNDYDYGRDAQIGIKCRNCDFTTQDPRVEEWDYGIAQFDRHHINHRYKVWNPEEEDWEEKICDGHDFQIVRYLTNRWSRGDEIPGDITVRCRKCGFADIVMGQWIPETECPNTGRSEDFVSFRQLDI